MQGEHIHHKAEALRDRHTVPEIAGRWVTLREAEPGQWIGPCPICSLNSSSQKASRFHGNTRSFICSSCLAAGDVIQLVAFREELHLVDAMSWLAMIDSPASAREVRRMGKAAFHAGTPITDVPVEAGPLGDDWRMGWQAAMIAERNSAMYREAERKRLRTFWDAALPLPGSPAAVWLNRRGLVLPDGAKMRYHPDYPYIIGGIGLAHSVPAAQVPYVGPALLAAIIRNDGKFGGIHAKWFDLSFDGATGEHPSRAAGLRPVILDAQRKPLPPEQSRGTTAGCHIEVVGIAEPARLILGPSLDACLAFHASFVKGGRVRELDGAAIWAAMGMQGLGGPAAFTLPHPTEKHANGHAVKLPGDKPMDGPHIVLPASITELVLLGEGEPVRRDWSIDRACRRYARPGLRIMPICTEAGVRFADLITMEVAA